ncbi:MAG: sensor histidine kinase [Proteocatella sp.]
MRLYFKSIHRSMLFSFVILLVPVVITFFAIFSYFNEKALLKNSEEYTIQLIEQVNNKVDSYIDFMENISNMILYTDEPVRYITSDFKNKEERSYLENNIEEQFKTILELREDIYNIAIYGENGRLILNDGNEAINPNIDIKSKGWYKKAMEANGKITLTAAHVQNIIDNKYRWVVNMSKAIVDPQTNQAVGVFWVDFRFNALSNFCESIHLGNKGYVFVLDEAGNLVYHPKQQLIYSGLEVERIADVMNSKTESFLIDNKDAGRRRLYTISRSDKTNWTVVGVSSTKELFRNKEQVQILYLIITCIILFTAVMISYFISKQISRPIKLLKESMREVEVGNFELASPIVINDSEIGKLGKTFSIMIEKIKTLMDEKLKEEEVKRQLEFKALQAQINPHFLYNTLDSIVWMAESGKNQEVIIMTVSLARLLRQSISNESSIVTIGQEINYVKSYLTIQKKRYQDQLNFKIEVPLEIQHHEIVKLTLQPIVENAIYHGIKYKDSKGEIQIKGYEEQDCIIIEIIDDGIGMDETTLGNILKKKPSTTKNGVGIYNVNKRIKLQYGEAYGLHYESRLNEGTRVILKLPDKKTVKVRDIE